MYDLMFVLLLSNEDNISRNTDCSDVSKNKDKSSELFYIVVILTCQCFMISYDDTYISSICSVRSKQPCYEVKHMLRIVVNL